MLFKISKRERSNVVVMFSRAGLLHDVIGILHEGVEQRSVLDETGQTWYTNPKGEFTRFD